jgi:myo-inositol-1(or 4)-monophosphatase
MTIVHSHDGEFNLIVDGAIDTGRTLRQHFGEHHAVLRDPKLGALQIELEGACEADLASWISRVFPDDGILGEEGTRVKSTSGRFWLVDPLCGTINYVRGIPEYAMSIACLDHGTPVFGLIHAPQTNETIWGSSGRPLVASFPNPGIRACSDLRDAVLTVGQHVLVGLEADYSNKLLSNTLRLRVPCSAAYEFLLLLSGRIDGYVQTRQAGHDFVAGCFLVGAVGGLAVVEPSDSAGDTIEERVHEVVASGNGIFETLAELSGRR